MFCRFEKFVAIVLTFCANLGNFTTDINMHDNVNNSYFVEPEIIEDSPIIELYIPKIKLKNLVYNLDSDLNDIDKNVVLMNGSDMPNVNNGNLILGGHSGIGKTAYFNKFNNLEIDDEIIVKYDNLLYKYNIVNIYLDDKDGRIRISQLNYTSIVLFTCMPGDKNNYLVIIGKLVEYGV